MNKKKIIVFVSLVWVGLLCMAGCNRMNAYSEPYSEYYEKKEGSSSSKLSGMSSELAVLSEDEQNFPEFYSSHHADLLINDSTKEVIESYQCFEQTYPASITKVMTALLTLEYGHFDEKITLKHDTVVSEDGAVISTLAKGDTVTVNQVFRTMLIKSANDCSVILAEHIAGSEEAFVEMMNEKAKELGATHTHFANTNGLHDDNHYTTAYDLYLIFREAVKYDLFVDTISQKDYTMTYTNEKGMEINEYMQSTNHYFLNEYSVPDGVIMYGGKTGTTSIAGSCLILMTENEKEEKFFSVILGAETKEDLYRSMSQLLQKTVN